VQLYFGLFVFFVKIFCFEIVVQLYFYFYFYF
jgi:hypothetical protein